MVLILQDLDAYEIFKNPRLKPRTTPTHFDLYNRAMARLE